MPRKTANFAHSVGNTVILNLDESSLHPFRSHNGEQGKIEACFAKWTNSGVPVIYYDVSVSNEPRGFIRAYADEVLNLSDVSGKGG